MRVAKHTRCAPAEFCVGGAPKIKQNLPHVRAFFRKFLRAFVSRSRAISKPERQKRSAYSAACCADRLTFCVFCSNAGLPAFAAKFVRAIRRKNSGKIGGFQVKQNLPLSLSRVFSRILGRFRTPKSSNLGAKCSVDRPESYAGAFSVARYIWCFPALGR